MDSKEKGHPDRQEVREREGEHPSALSVDIKQKAFRSPRGTRSIFTDLRLDVTTGEFFTILGPSGCGKTTLLRICAGLDSEFEGEVLINGAAVHAPGRDRGVVFQEARLLPWFRVGKNVALALHARIPKAERVRRVTEALELVGLPESVRQWPSELSGGMARRVALARALVGEQEILLLDEPLTGLDLASRHQLQEQILRVHQLRPTLTVIMVTHDVEEAAFLSTRVLFLSASNVGARHDLAISEPRPRGRRSASFMSICSNLATSIVTQSAEATR